MGFDTSYYYWYGIELDVDTTLHYDLQNIGDEYLCFEVFGNFSSGEHTGSFLKFSALRGDIGSSNYREVYPLVSVSSLYKLIDEYVLNHEKHKIEFKLSKYESPKDYLDDFAMKHLSYLLEKNNLDKIKTKGIFDWHIVSFGS